MRSLTRVVVCLCCILTLSSCTGAQVQDWFWTHRHQRIDWPTGHAIAVQINQHRARVAYLNAVAGGDCAPGKPDACAALIRREFAARGLDGNAAVRVASCESGLNPQASNGGSYLGLFQQAAAYWPDRARTYGVAGQSAFNPRANVIVSAGMVAGSGWAHWSCRP